MKIGLIDVDSHNFPNLCLMKLSAYHKAKGHTVEWWNAKGRYDLVYKSRVFTDTYSKDTITVTNAEQVIFGGTGYDMILSRLVDTFFSRISLTMPPAPKSHNTAYVLPWEEPLHWQSRSSGYSSS